MTKRFTISIDSNDRKSLWDEERTEEEPLIALNRFGEIWGIDDCCKLLNKLNDENKELKRELQRMYDVGTLNKAMDVLEKRYDKMLSDGSDEIKDAKRMVVLKCIDDLNEFKDDLTMR